MTGWRDNRKECRPCAKHQEVILHTDQDTFSSHLWPCKILLSSKRESHLSFQYCLIGFTLLSPAIQATDSALEHVRGYKPLAGRTETEDRKLFLKQLQILFTWLLIFFSLQLLVPTFVSAEISATDRCSKHHRNCVWWHWYRVKEDSSAGGWKWSQVFYF